MNYISIAIDGPAGAGKSTIAKELASKLNFVYIDTGAMYRAITYKALKLNIKLDDTSSYQFLDNTNLELTKDNKILIDNVDVTKEIRKRAVTNSVSIVSSIKKVRETLVTLQRKMALNQDVIMDGRDIGSNVLKDATIKFFLTASVLERAKRRYLELNNKVSFDIVKRDIINRDNIDSTRELNPLVKAHDAIEIDTSNLTALEVVNILTDIILGKVNTNG